MTAIDSQEAGMPCILYRRVSCRPRTTRLLASQHKSISTQTLRSITACLPKHLPNEYLYYMCRSSLQLNSF